MNSTPLIGPNWVNDTFRVCVFNQVDAQLAYEIAHQLWSITQNPAISLKWGVRNETEAGVGNENN